MPPTNESETATRRRTPQISCSHEKYANSKIDTHHGLKRGGAAPHESLKMAEFRIRHWHTGAGCAHSLSTRITLFVANERDGFRGWPGVRSVGWCLWSIWRAIVVWQLAARTSARVRRALEADADCRSMSTFSRLSSRFEIASRNTALCRQNGVVLNCYYFWKIDFVKFLKIFFFQIYVR